MNIILKCVSKHPLEKGEHLTLYLVNCTQLYVIYKNLQKFSNYRLLMASDADH
jgi:hypothetical protein